MVLTLSPDPIDPAAMYDRIAKASSGSVVFHYAVVKEMKRQEGKTSCIEYASSGDSQQELARIAAELTAKWQLEDVILVRRIGCLGIGDIISLVAASSPNSEDAFGACRDGIACLKKMATIRKTEVFR